MMGCEHPAAPAIAAQIAQGPTEVHQAFASTVLSADVYLRIEHIAAITDPRTPRHHAEHTAYTFYGLSCPHGGLGTCEHLLQSLLQNASFILH